MRKFVLLLTLIILPKFVDADMLHILDNGGAADSHHNGSETIPENIDVRTENLTNPGRGCVFNFEFKESPEKFQWQVNVVVENNPRDAGHNHSTPPPELFYYPNWPNTKKVARLDGVTVRSPLLDQSQRFSVHLSTINYSTVLIARGVYTLSYHGKILNPTVTHTLRIKTQGLERLPRNDRLYASIGVTVFHPEKHYGTSVTITALNDLATKWKSIYTTRPLLEIGNISLPWGGVFDTNADWKTKDIDHAFGIAADIGKRSFNTEERIGMIKLMCGNGFYVYNATEDNKEQYHIINKKEFGRLKALKWPLYLPKKTDVTTIDCCAAKTGTQEYASCIGFKPQE